MNLVGYSDSEGSDNEAPPAPKPSAKASATSSKPTFQKLIDRANPNKIKVNLPSAPKPNTGKDDIEETAPPAKKARTGGGGFGGFNAMLPAPKKSAPAAGAISAGKRGLGRGLGAGISLKTGAEPAFSREPVNVPDYGEDGTPLKNAPATGTSNLPPPIKEQKEEEPEIKLVGRPMKFMPLSVTNKKKKKPAVIPQPSGVAAEKPAPAAILPTAEPKPAPKPKVSLFSITKEESAVSSNPSLNEKYEPLLFGGEEEDEVGVPDEALEDSNTQPRGSMHSLATSSNAAGGPQTLTQIASSLNLSEAEKRQLFGRKGKGDKFPDLSGVNIVDFNTDAEYAHNEQLRAAGETVQHNALKSISGTGKNSLRSLINVAATQKDALEEHFATGRRNKKEAGNKYGW